MKANTVALGGNSTEYKTTSHSLVLTVTNRIPLENLLKNQESFSRIKYLQVMKCQWGDVEQIM